MALRTDWRNAGSQIVEPDEVASLIAGLNKGFCWITFGTLSLSPDSELSFSH